MSRLARLPALETSVLDAVLLPQYRGMGDAALLEYFRLRTEPTIAVVEEIEQTTPERLSAVLENRFCFNNEWRALPAPFDWSHNPSSDIEWQILLHKFYYLVGLARHWRETGDAAYAEKATALWASWIDAALPPDFIAADVAGRRIQNWIYAWSLLRGASQLGPDLNARILRTLHAEVSWLRNNLHKKRNHRTLELYAVFLWAVAFPEFRDSEELRRFSLEELARNAQEDFHPDGSHCEQSTHYHCIVLRNFLNIVRLARLNGIAIDTAFEGRIRSALEFAAAVHRPDGEIAALSDADGGSYLGLIAEGCQILDLKLGPVNSRHFADGGLVVMSSAPNAAERPEDRRFLLLDGGPLGEGNHGHLDALSIEVFSHGQPLIVDPGRYTYDESGDINWRVLFRETRAHSTVQVDGRNQARYAPGRRKWKIAGPAPAVSVENFSSANALTHVHSRVASSEYDAVHHRHVFFFDQSYWLVLDLLTAPTEHVYDLRFQLAPELADAAIMGAGAAQRVHSAYATLDVLASTHMTAVIEQGWISRRYGEKFAAPRPCMTVRACNVAFASLVLPSRSAGTGIELHRLALRETSGSVELADPLAGRLHRIWFDEHGAMVASVPLDAHAPAIPEAAP